MLWIPFIILISSSTLVVWWLSPIEQIYVYWVIGGIGTSMYYLSKVRISHPLSTSVAKANNVIDLDAFRRRKQEEAKRHLQSSKVQWVSIFEAPYVIEADLVASMLESHGIATQILNRHLVSILIHPINELTVKILVPTEEAPRAIRLIQQQHHEQTSPDPSGKSSA